MIASHYTVDRLARPVYSRDDPLRSSWKLSHQFKANKPLCSSCNKTQDPYQDNRTNDRNDDTANETKVGIGYKQVNEQAANECADEANNDVTDDSIAAGTHDPANALHE